MEHVTNHEMSQLTLKDFHSKLSERVSDYNARLLLHTVVVKTGMNNEKDRILNKEEARTLCLALIRQGGPGFQVGKAMFSDVQ